MRKQLNISLKNQIKKNTELENQINLACNVIKDTVSEGQTGYIDMRYSNMAFFNEGTINAD